MKAVLKTISSKDDLDYDELFNSEKNATLYYSLFLELRKSLALNFRPFIDQLINWLKTLYKSRQTARRIKKSGKSPSEL